MTDTKFQITEDVRRQWINPPALDLAATPVDQRGEFIDRMLAEIDAWLRLNWPELSPQDVLKVRERYSFEIIRRAGEISKGCSHVVGHG
jgi:hypothetical protein